MMTAHEKLRLSMNDSLISAKLDPYVPAGVKRSIPQRPSRTRGLADSSRLERRRIAVSFLRRSP